MGGKKYDNSKPKVTGFNAPTVLAVLSQWKATPLHMIDIFPLLALH